MKRFNSQRSCLICWRAKFQKCAYSFVSGNTDFLSWFYSAEAIFNAMANTCKHFRLDTKSDNFRFKKQSLQRKSNQSVLRALGSIK
jgi:hypothetical protein